LLDTENEDVQKTAYRILKLITTRRVQDLSLKVEMANIEIAPTLNSFLFNKISKSATISSLEIFGYFISWLLVIDHFEEAV
jgi:hypothetical protein